MKRHLTILAAAAMAALFASCAPQNAGPLPIARYAFEPESFKTDPNEAVSFGFWDRPDGLEGEHLIVIDTRLQQATYYIAGQKVGYSTCSTGKEGHGTPRGTYKVLAKDADHKSSTYGSIVDAAGNTLIADYKAGQPIPPGGRYKGADMNNALQLTTGGIWLHEGLVTSAPESHGCIRLPGNMAKIFFDNTPVGTKVIVK